MGSMWTIIQILAPESKATTGEELPRVGPFITMYLVCNLALPPYGLFYRLSSP